MPKYRVKKLCSWKTFRVEPTDAGKVIDAADLKTTEGQPLPERVKTMFIAAESLVPLTEAEEAAFAAKEAAPAEQPLTPESANGNPHQPPDAAPNPNAVRPARKPKQ